VYCVGLLCEQACYCSTNLAIYATPVGVDARALVFLVFSVVSTACFVRALVYVGLWAVSPGRGDKVWNRLLRLEILSALTLYVIVYLLPGVDLSNVACACASRL
ncbi:hypothetical protein COCCADRAFT_112945, partial [Bipolaris zeicola 26-R-13]